MYISRASSNICNDQARRKSIGKHDFWHCTKWHQPKHILCLIFIPYYITVRPPQLMYNVQSVSLFFGFSVLDVFIPTLPRAFCTLQLFPAMQLRLHVWVTVLANIFLWAVCFWPVLLQVLCYALCAWSLQSFSLDLWQEKGAQIRLIWDSVYRKFPS